jgi:hypothetical protein
MKYLKLNFGPFIKYREMDGEKIIRHFRHFHESDSFDFGFRGRESWACPVTPRPKKEEITKEEFEEMWKNCVKSIGLPKSQKNFDIKTIPKEEFEILFELSSKENKEKN